LPRRQASLTRSSSAITLRRRDVDVNGWKRDTLKFNQLGVEAIADQMVVATCAAAGGTARTGGSERQDLMQIVPSARPSCCWSYACGLIFTLRTHRHLLRGDAHSSAPGTRPINVQ
jgi:hypothetical protein